jgi:hypothetical protein
MKKFKDLSRILIVLAVVFAAFSFWNCSKNLQDSTTGLNENEGLAKVTIANVDSVINMVLPATSDGINYDFNVYGTAYSTQADFVLDVNRTGELDVIHSVVFSLPLADVDADSGETGSGSITADISSDFVNIVTIPFEWDAVNPQGEAAVNLTFSHPPGINDWSATPGPGAPAGTDVSVQADLTFFGSTPVVEVQFYGSGSPLGTPVALTESGGLWSGKIAAESGADALRLTATDDEGTNFAEMAFPVP